MLAKSIKEGDINSVDDLLKDLNLINNANISRERKRTDEAKSFSEQKKVIQKTKNAQIQNIINEIQYLENIKSNYKKIKNKKVLDKYVRNLSNNFDVYDFDDFKDKDPLKMINPEDFLIELSENEIIEKLDKEIARLKEELKLLENQKGKDLKISNLQPLAKLPIYLAQLHAGNNSKELKNDINKLLKELYKSKQISKLVYENLIAAIKLIKMTKSDQIKILNDKSKANKAQYDLDRLNAEIFTYSNGDLDKYEYLTKNNLGYKPDALEQAKFAYSPLGKVFTDGLTKKDKFEKVGIFKRLKNIEDNLSGDYNGDDNDEAKVGIFKIIKNIKNRGIKISNDDEAIREIRNYIQELRDRGVRLIILIK